MQQDDFDRPGAPKLTSSGPVKKVPREQKAGNPDEGEGGPTMAVSDPTQIIADAIRLRVVTVSVDQAEGAAEDVQRRLNKAGYEVRKK